MRLEGCGSGQGVRRDFWVKGTGTEGERETHCEHFDRRRAHASRLSECVVKDIL